MPRWRTVGISLAILAPISWAVGGALSKARTLESSSSLVQTASLFPSGGQDPSGPTGPKTYAPPLIAFKTIQSPDNKCFFRINVYTTHESAGAAVIVEWIGIYKTPGTDTCNLCVENGSKLISYGSPAKDLLTEVMSIPCNSPWYITAKPIGKNWLDVANIQLADGHFANIDIDLQVHPTSDLLKNSGK
jgi:hypothetical protein